MAREGANLIQQIGVQTTPGTPVAATKRLTSIGIDIGLDLVTKQFRSHAAKANTTSVIHKKMSQGRFEGPLSYIELVYILSSLQSTVAVTATGVTTWTSTPNQIGSDTSKLYTLEQGDDEDTEQYADLLFTSLDISWGLEDVMMSGNCFAKPKTTLGAGLTTSIALLAERPVSARDITIYCDNSAVGLGGTALSNPFDAKLSLGDKFAPKWVLNRTKTTYSEPYEKISDKTFTITVEADSEGRALLSDLIANNTIKFFRVEALGPIIAAATPYTIQVDFAAQLTGVKEQKDYLDSIFAYELTFTLIQETTFAKPYLVVVKNALTAL